MDVAVDVGFVTVLYIIDYEELCFSSQKYHHKTASKSLHKALVRHSQVQKCFQSDPQTLPTSFYATLKFSI